MARGVEVRTTSSTTPPWAAPCEIRSSPVYAGHTIKPLKNFRFARAPAVSDRIEAIRERKAPALIPPGRRNPSFRTIQAECLERNDLLPYRVFGMRARTCQQPPARPEAVVYRVLSGLPRAKFRPDRRPLWRRIWARNSPEIFLWPAPSHPGRLARLGRRRFPCGV